MFVFVFVFANSNLNDKKDIKTFTTGAILGMVVIGDPEYYTRSLGEADAWAIGKLVYKILEVLRFPQELVKKCNGFVGTFFIDDEVENAILKNHMVQDTISLWNAKYESTLEAPYDTNEKRSELSEKNKSKYKALSVKQPILQAIMDGFKKCENRSKAVIPLKGSELKVREFKETLCRFCPNQNPMECIYILHLGVSKYKQWQAEQKFKMSKKKKKKESFVCKCNYPGCGNSFELRSALLRHNTKVHKLPKPYQCKVCYKKFGDRDLLKKHFQRHLKR